VILTPNSPSLRESVLKNFAGQGIDPSRLDLVSRCPRAEYLKRIAAVDIALDPFPMNGHTTTCDALWQGVPVITLAGTNYASRFGSSAHNVLGLTEFVATSTAEYVATATTLASDLERLSALRSNLRPRMAASALLDGPSFARRVEAAYRQMWTDWLKEPNSTGAAGT
jgi:predicted O-linked N-acetylglucosamine transferase (SPINDLY family)